MSFNPFYNNFSGVTFQSNVVMRFPPPPLPPPYFIPPSPALQTVSDEDFVKRFRYHMSILKNKHKPSRISINEFKGKLHTLILTLNDLKDKEKTLRDNVDNISEAEWLSSFDEIERIKAQINLTITDISDSYLDSVTKLLAKRSSKRLRLKRVNMEKKKEKEQKIKELKERSRKIDENLQKIKDEITRAKQEEESKLQADMILKEVLRKKHDAKKCVAKLSALVKLRRARQNTARGRGESVSDRDADTFNRNIEKLQSLWEQKLSLYEKEEMELRAKLKQDTNSADTIVGKQERQVVEDLAKWRKFLFGDGDITPQIDFGGDVGRFVGVRSQWDQFLSSDGSPLPVGWVLPQLKTQ